MTGAAEFHAQADALFRKNLAIQKRAYKTNCCIVLFPLIVCGLLGATQMTIDSFFTGDDDEADCKACAGARPREDAVVGGPSCAMECPLPAAPRWPVALLLPGGDEDDGVTGEEEDRAPPPAPDAAKEEEEESPEELLESLTKPPKCRSPESCAAPAKFLVTGSNKSFAESLTGNMFPPHASANLTADISGLADFALVGKCTPNSTLSFQVQEGPERSTKDARCTQGFFEWCESSKVMNNELYRGYNQDKTQERW